MGEAIGQELAFAVGIALSPIPIVGVILMLATPRGRANGLAFVGGWVVGLAGLGTIVLLVSGGAGASERGAPADWVGVVKLVLGVLLLALAARRWRGRPRGGEAPEMPAWMRAVDGFTARRSAALGFALAAINPKNLLLTIGAATAIAQTGATAAGQAVALAVFVAIGTLGAGLPVLLHLVRGERARGTLDELRDWMIRHGAAVMAVLLVLIGAMLVGDGIAVLSA